MNAPWGEERHYEQAHEALTQGDLDTPETEEQRSEREAYEAEQADWKRRLSRLYHVDPALWAELEARTVPRPGSAHMVMRPPVAMDFATLAGYQMGQHCMVRLFRVTAEEEAKRNG